MRELRWSDVMADRLNGYRILILETREEAQFSRLLGEQGADVLQCPMFTIHDAPDPAPVEAWIRRAIEKPFDDVVLMTGEGLRRLMKVARRTGIDQDFVAAPSLVITDKADVTVAVLAPVDELARERYQLSNIRCAKPAVTQLQFCGNRIADTNAIIRCVTHASSK